MGLSSHEYYVCVCVRIPHKTQQMRSILVFCKTIVLLLFTILIVGVFVLSLQLTIWFRLFAWPFSKQLKTCCRWSVEFVNAYFVIVRNDDWWFDLANLMWRVFILCILYINAISIKAVNVLCDCVYVCYFGIYLSLLSSQRVRAKCTTIRNSNIQAYTIYGQQPHELRITNQYRHMFSARTFSLFLLLLFLSFHLSYIIQLHRIASNEQALACGALYHFSFWNFFVNLTGFMSCVFGWDKLIVWKKEREKDP